MTEPLSYAELTTLRHRVCSEGWLSITTAERERLLCLAEEHARLAAEVAQLVGDVQAMSADYTTLRAENAKLREQVASLRVRADVFLRIEDERDALRAENRRLNAIILAGGETLERQRVELAQNHEDWTALRAENAKLRTVRACAWRWLTYETSAERASLEVALAATEKEPK